MPSNLSRRGKSASSNCETPRSGDETQSQPKKGKLVFVSRKLTNSSDWHLRHLRRERLDGRLDSSNNRLLKHLRRERGSIETTEGLSARSTSETPQETEAIHQHDREGHRQQSLLSCSQSLLQQPLVHSKMSKFHSGMAVSLPWERFPGMTATKCVCSTHDKHNPKAYSSDSNMHPGPVPTTASGVAPTCIALVFMMLYTALASSQAF